MPESIKILSGAEIEAGLKTLPGWTRQGDKITKIFVFESFKQAVDFVVGLQPFCDENDHHPDIHIFYNKVIFNFQRYDIGGKITDKDFLVAREIEKRYQGK